MEEKISEVDEELHEASEQLRKLTVKRRKAEAEGLRVSDASKAVLGGRIVSGVCISEGEFVLARATGQRCSKEVGDGGSVSSVGGSKKKRKEACQLNDVDVDMDENDEALRLIPSAMSSSVDGMNQSYFATFRKGFKVLRRVSDG